MKKPVCAFLAALMPFLFSRALAADNFQTAINLYLAHDFSGAVSTLEPGIRSDPGDWKARQLLGYCYYRLQDEEKALEECKESLRHNGANPRLEQFVKWLASPAPRTKRGSDQGAYLETREEAKMPPPPDQTEGDPAVPFPKSEGDFFRNFRFQLGTGTDFLGLNYDHDRRGFATGINGAIGYAFDEHWSLWFSESAYFFPGFHYPYYYIDSRWPATLLESVLSVRYTFGGAFLKPYLTAGGGFFYTDSGVFAGHLYHYYDYLAPLLQAGVGVQCPVGPGLIAYAEARGNVIYQTLNVIAYQAPLHVTAVDFPVNAGVILDLSEDDARDPVFLAAHPPPSRDNFFLKTGGGYVLNSYVSRLTLTTSTAFGYDFHDHFSFFASAEFFPGDLGLLANVQYTLPTAAFFRPYFFGGAGFAVPDAPGGVVVGMALQIGTGLNFQLNGETALYAEAKAYGTSYMQYYPALLRQYSDMVFVAGLKYSLPKTPAKAEPENGRLFVCIGGGADLPDRNRHPECGYGWGGGFSAGYEFNGGLALQLDVTDIYFSGYSGPHSYDAFGVHRLFILPTVRYLIGKNGFRPYLTAGAGLVTELSWSDLMWGYNNLNYGPPNLDAAAGTGIEFALDARDAIFVEGKYNLLFENGAASPEFLITAGIRLGVE